MRAVAMQLETMGSKRESTCHVHDNFMTKYRLADAAGGPAAVVASNGMIRQI